MRLLQVSIAIAAISAAVAQLSPPSLEVAAHQLTRNGKRDISKNELWKRKGGGGGGGRGGGGGGGGRGSSSSSSSSSGYAFLFRSALHSTPLTESHTDAHANRSQS